MAMERSDEADRNPSGPGHEDAVLLTGPPLLADPRALSTPPVAARGVPPFPPLANNPLVYSVLDPAPPPPADLDAWATTGRRARLSRISESSAWMAAVTWRIAVGAPGYGSSAWSRPRCNRRWTPARSFRSPSSPRPRPHRRTRRMRALRSTSRGPAGGARGVRRDL